MAASQRSPESIQGGSAGRVLVDNGSTGIWATVFPQVFTGDGTTVAFTCTHAPIAGIMDFVTVDGLMSMPDIGMTTLDYTVSSTTLTFHTPPENGSRIAVQYKCAI